MEIKKKAIAHYEKMIKWAKLQNGNAITDHFFMFETLGEFWQGHFCSYCQEYLKGDLFCSYCSICPLTKNNLNTKYCCYGLWHKMNHSKTWKEWIKYAEKILKLIKKMG